MNDNEIRGFFLKKLWEHRKENQDMRFVLRPSDFSFPITAQEITRIGLQLQEHNLAKICTDVGNVWRITASGVDIVERGGIGSPIEVKITNISNSVGVIIGNNNTQDIRNSITEISTAIDNAVASEQQKAEAKNLFLQFLRHPLVVSITEGVAQALGAAMLVIIGFALLFCVRTYAQEIVNTKDGRRVMLNQDGTWSFLTNATYSSQSSIDTVRAYLESDSWRGRLSLVLNQEKVKPLMEKRYNSLTEWKKPVYHILTTTETTTNENGLVKIEADVSGKTQAYFLRKTQDGYRIDWEMSIVVNSFSSLDTIRAYLEAESWRERLAFVFNPEQMKPIMERYYEGKTWWRPTFQLLTTIEPTPNQEGYVKIEADVDGKQKTYYLKKTKDGYRIDWETSVGFNRMSAAEFHATRPTTPVQFRVLGKLSDYYNYEFKKAKNEFWSVSISDGEQNYGTGYIAKNSTTGDRLFKTLKDGKKHELIVDLVYLPNTESADLFLIAQVVSVDSWWLGASDNHPIQQGAAAPR